MACGFGGTSGIPACTHRHRLCSLVGRLARQWRWPKNFDSTLCTYSNVYTVWIISWGRSSFCKSRTKRHWASHYLYVVVHHCLMHRHFHYSINRTVIRLYCRPHYQNLSWTAASPCRPHVGWIDVVWFCQPPNQRWLRQLSFRETRERERENNYDSIQKQSKKEKKIRFN